MDEMAYIYSRFEYIRYTKEEYKYEIKRITGKKAYNYKIWSLLLQRSYIGQSSNKELFHAEEFMSLT